MNPMWLFLLTLLLLLLLLADSLEKKYNYSSKQTDVMICVGDGNQENKPPSECSYGKLSIKIN